ncbi:hypothetical protein MUN74_04945 [Agromyces endophyticus]|uniref:hypothetical protein n=1 Tax=Agromyces sp. H17E-10 TaxID=2932244 RepID=UPI001FD17359|nr:hypothetical protein [Agromyces sp. H17E-10]UOQ90272.1 hypothetical protein MUN74_04945 [Agromyces sp. H17E-10]
MRTEPPTGEEMAGLLASAKGGLMTEARRTPRRPHRIERLVGSMVAAVLLIALVTGGALVAFTLAPAPFAGPAPVPTESASPPPTAPESPSPTEAESAPEESPVTTPTPAEAADRLDTVTTIVVRPEAIDFEDAAGTIVTAVSYDDGTDLIVSTLTAVLGAEPTVEEKGSGEFLGYDWSGLYVNDDLVEGPGRLRTNVIVTFSRPLVGDGVAVTTTAGFAPGDDVEQYMASIGDQTFTEYAENLVALETGAELGPPVDGGGVNAHSVVASDWLDDWPSVVIAPINLGLGQASGL